MKYNHILVAIELSDDSKVLIDRATFLAGLLDAKVSFIHIDGSHGEIYPELIDLQQSYENPPINKHALEQIQAFVDYAQVPITHNLIGTGALSEKLQATITANGFDLLIAGHHHDFWSSIVSYSKNLIDKSPIDILVVPIKS